jgi:translation initiation factor eIF-2B subunit delta
MRTGVQFRVVVADAGPKFEGKELMRRLLRAGLKCTYVNLHALSYIMHDVSKLLLGASSMLLNGTLVARAGTAVVCMLAHEHGVPALVCCETYKFADRVLLDSICFNELGDPDELIPPGERPDAARRLGSSGAVAAGGGVAGVGAAGGGGVAGKGGAEGGAPPARVADWRDIPRLKLLNLMYDATPMRYLTMVVTEVGVIPPTSVPAVIREGAAREEREEAEERKRPSDRP